MDIAIQQLNETSKDAFVESLIGERGEVRLAKLVSGYGSSPRLANHLHKRNLCCVKLGLIFSVVFDFHVFDSFALNSVIFPSVLSPLYCLS